LLPFWKSSLEVIWDLMIQTSLVALSVPIVVSLMVESVSVALQWPISLSTFDDSPLGSIFEFPAVIGDG
jgi:hypothetical protein